jgi:pSer/pThr/pTyr-binding forkhead associated (FHA) protein
VTKLSSLILFHPSARIRQLDQFQSVIIRPTLKESRSYHRRRAGFLNWDWYSTLTGGRVHRLGGQNLIDSDACRMSTSGSPEPMSLTAAFAAACKLTAPLTIRTLHRGTGAVQSHTIRQSFATLGRAKGVGVRLDDPSVSQCHAYLQVVDGVLHCVDLGSRTGVLWDHGGRGRGCVYPGQTVQIGMFDVQLDGPPGDPLPPPELDDRLEPVPDPDAPPPPALEVYAPGGPNGQCALDRPVTMIGRHPGCNLRFLNDGVAYFQCALVNTHDGVWCVDIFSQRGTTLNGRATRLARLQDGDLLELGKVSLLLRTGSEVGHSLALSPVGGLQVIGPPSAPQNGANALATALAPFREMMEQFHQSFVAMARMFTTMQQEHTAMMCEQMRQLQEFLRQSRPAPAPTPPAPTPPAPAEPAPPPPGPAATATPAPPPTPRTPTQKVSNGTDADALADAHNWFLERMAKLGQPPTAPK